MIEIVTEIEIAGPVSQVWRVLTDFPAYPRWNPVVRSIRGAATPGATLYVVFHPRGSIPVWFPATVSVASADTEFTWTGSLLTPRIFSGEHYFRLEAIDGKRTRLIHGEAFRGPLAPLMYRMLGNYNRSGFVAMNDALKAHIEAAQPRG